MHPLPLAEAASSARLAARRRAATAVVLALGLILLLGFTPYLTGLIAVPVLYVIVSPLHRAFARHLGAKSGAALVLALLLFLLIVIGGSFVRLIVTEAQQIAANAPQSPILSGLAQLRTGGVDVGPQLADLGTKLVGWLGTYGFGIFGSASRWVLNLTIALFGLFYLLLRPRETWDTLQSYIPFSTRHTETLRQQFRDVTTSTVLGTGLSAAIQGLLVCIGFWVAGLPNAALWGVAAMIFAVVPLVGSALVWGPGAIALLLDHRLGAAVLLALWGLIVIANVGHVILPIVSRHWGGVHPLVTFLGAVVGVPVFGLLGLLIGPLALSYFFELITMYREDYLADS